MTRLIVYSAKNPAEIFLDTENFGSSRFLVGDLWHFFIASAGQWSISSA